MPTHNVFVRNNTGSPLFVTGSYGDDLLNINLGQEIKDGDTDIVGRWDSTGTGDKWDYIYLGDKPGVQLYQLYMEDTAGGTYYQFMGYKTTPSNSNSNPKPFKAGCSECSHVDGRSGDWLYDFLKAPEPATTPDTEIAG